MGAHLTRGMIEMKITWEIEDGYLGGSRPQRTFIPDEDLAECETDEERESLIRECINDDFADRIHWAEIRRD